MNWMFYGFQLFFLLTDLVMYVDFRDGVYTAFHISPKRKKREMVHFLWWKELSQEKALGVLLVANRYTIVAWAVAFVITAATGFLPWMQIPVLLLMTLLSLPLVPMNVFAFVYHNRAEYGASFVWLARKKDGSKKLHSSVIDVFWSVTPWIMMAFDWLILT